MSHRGSGVGKTMTCCLWRPIWLGDLTGWVSAGGSLTTCIAVRVRVMSERWSIFLIIGNDLPWLGLTLSLHSCANSSLWDSHHNRVLFTNSESLTQTNHTTSKSACRPHQKLGRPQASRAGLGLTVSASTKRVGHSEQEVSIWEELTNLDPMPRRLSPR